MVNIMGHCAWFQLTSVADCIKANIPNIVQWTMWYVVHDYQCGLHVANYVVNALMW